jgi:hemerythrin-like domain-containing protein
MMKDPISAWRTDHANFARLLELLEEEVAAFHAGETPDYALMLDVVEFLRDFGDRSHHPREDVAFASLVQRDPSMQLQVARRLQEHRVITAVGADLVDTLQGVMEDDLTDRAGVEAAAATYLVYYRHHLAAEEGQVIPRAVQVLTAEDWAAVAAAAPPFGEEREGEKFEVRYRDLLAQLARRTAGR